MGAVRLAVVQKKGQVTIPAEFRRRYRIEEGGYVAFIETERGLLLSPRKMVTLELMDQLRDLLVEQDVSLDDLIASERSSEKPA